MKIENQVCTLEQAKRLYDFKIKQDSIYCFRQSLYNIPMDINNGDWRIKLKSYTDTDEILSAFTVAELGVMLPDNHLAIRTTIDEIAGWEYFKSGSLMPMIDVSTEAECRANILIHLLENNLITTDEVNQKLN